MCHVLVIEDDFFVADYIIQLIESAGATSTELAVTEDEAVAAALANPPALIMADVTLAAGTGPAAVRTITGQLGRLPVIFVTASPADCVGAETPSTVLGKPIDERLLIATFQKLARL